MSDYNADFLTMLQTWDAAVQHMASRDATSIQRIDITNLLGCEVKPPSLLAFSIAHPLRPRSKLSSFSKLNSDVRKARRGAHGLETITVPPNDVFLSLHRVFLGRVQFGTCRLLPTNQSIWTLPWWIIAPAFSD